MSAPIVTTQNGQVRGKTAENYLGGTFYSFLGIPYGKPPVGELRFKAPLPAEPWEGIRDATKEGPECPSRHMFFTYFIGDEANCLNLNVYTRSLPAEETALKPVMVWIHGGAFLYGSNKSELYGPDYLMTEDIVFVNINYRMGVFGFLSLEDSSLGVPGNAGLKDMVLALKWVQDNIKHFNGDPNNVTIFGESAGAASVHLLYLSPLAKGLFHKAIIQSGVAVNLWAKGCCNGQLIADSLGYKEKDEKKILEYLRNVSAAKIVKAQHKAPDNFTGDTVRPYGPVIEKPSEEAAFLSEDPLEILKAGKFNQVPLIMGYTTREGIFFEAVRALIPNTTVPRDFEREVPYDLHLEKGSDKSKEIATKIQKFYFGEEEASEKNIDKTYLLKTDAQFLNGIHRCLALQKQQSEAPIYLYRMSLDTSINYYKIMCLSKSVHLLFLFYFLKYKSGKQWFLRLSKAMHGSRTVNGVCHADDVGYLMNSFISPKLEKGSPEEIGVRRFVKLWTNFARTGNPTPEENDDVLDGVRWQPVTKEENKFLDIGTELKVGSNPDLDRIQFWEGIYTQ